MLKYCKEKWAENEKKLKTAIENSTNHHDWYYKDLVKMIVRFVLNPVKDNEFKWSEEIHEIDDGEYQGSLLYLIHRDCYQPREYYYLVTYVDYGSCSGCDTLLHIQSYDDDYDNWEDRRKALPTEEQTKDYMKLCRDIVMNMKCPFTIEKEFEEEIMDGEDDVYNPDRI